jgi:hypothetical protein
MPNLMAQIWIYAHKRIKACTSRKKQLMEDKIFDIAFETNGRQYKGWVNPSEKMTEDGAPCIISCCSGGYLFRIFIYS